MTYKCQHLDAFSNVQPLAVLPNQNLPNVNLRCLLMSLYNILTFTSGLDDMEPGQKR